MRIAQRANHLTENLVDRDGMRKDKRKSESLAARIPSSMLNLDPNSNPSADPASGTEARFKHHDLGFRGLELDDELKIGKRSFNANSMTQKPAKFDAADERKRFGR